MPVKTVKPDAMLKKAQAVPEGDVQQLHFDPMIAKKSITDGLFYLGKRFELLKAEYAGFKIDELLLLPQLCDRVSEKQREVDTLRGVRTINSPLLTTEALGWRRKLMPIAESLAENGKLDPVAVAKIRSGRGNVDGVRDVIDLVSQLAPHEAAVTSVCGPKALERASTAANEALKALGYSQNDPELAREAAALRDRYATLVLQGYDRLKTAVAAVSTFKNAEVVVGGLSNNPSGRPVTPEVAPGIVPG